MISKKMNASTIIRLAEEVAVLAGEECSDAIRIALEERKTRMLRAPSRSKVLTQEEIKELLSYSPLP